MVQWLTAVFPTRGMQVQSLVGNLGSIPHVALSFDTLFAPPVDRSPPGSSVQGILQNTGAGCRFLLQGNLSNSGTEPASPTSPPLAGGFFTTGPRISHVVGLKINK